MACVVSPDFAGSGVDVAEQLQSPSYELDTMVAGMPGSDWSEEETAGSDRSLSSSKRLQPSEVEEILENNKIICPSSEDGSLTPTASRSQSPDRRHGPRRRSSIWNGFWACLSPVVGYLRKDVKEQVGDL